jgi:hypothetical protein
MRIEDLKRWHWIVIGALAGLLLGYVYSGMEPTDPGRSLGATDFQRAALNTSRNPATEGYPLVRNIVVYPPEIGAYGKPVHRVHFELLHYDQADPTKWVYRPSHMKAEVPFDRNNPNPDNTVLDFLAEAKKQNDKLTYRSAWERKPANMYLLFLLGGVVVIGGIWPTIINLLVGRGFGKRSEPKPELDLSRYRHTDTRAEDEALGIVKGSKAITDEDRAELDSMVRKLEQSVGNANLGSGGTVSEPHKQAPVRQLGNAPVEPLKPVVNQEEEPKEYVGEYYPVVKPHHHPRDEKK